jgi:hypothetical protein
MYDMGNDTHVADICGMVHQLPELLCREVDHGRGKAKKENCLRYPKLC